MKILAEGSTSRLYRQARGREQDFRHDGRRLFGLGASTAASVSLYAVAAGGGGLDKIEASVDGVLDDIRAHGVTEIELARAKKSLLADYIYESDNQASLARRYGWGVAVGRSMADIEKWPQAIASVTPDDVKRAAETYLDLRGSVTGWLEPGRAKAREPRRAAGCPVAS